MRDEVKLLRSGDGSARFGTRIAVAPIPDDRQPFCAGHAFFGELQTFCSEIAGDERDSGEIAAGPCEGRHCADSNRIAQCEHHDRYRACGLLGGQHRGRPGHRDHVRLLLEEFLADRVDELHLTLRGPVNDFHGLTGYVTEFAQSFEKGPAFARRRLRDRREQQISDARAPCALGKQPTRCHDRAGAGNEQRTALHSFTAMQNR